MSIFFIGRGALLAKAIEFTIEQSIPVAGASCMPGDLAIARISKLGVEIYQSNNPNQDLLPVLSSKEISFVFSINNKFILHDELLSLGPNFYNIHSGLIQSYRGIAEICMIVALCRRENIYGVTIHQLLPNQEVDTGPTIGQIQFAILKSHNFSDLIKLSFNSADSIFKSYLPKIISHSETCTVIEPSTEVHTYNNLRETIKLIDPKRLNEVTDLGAFSRIFPKLDSLLGEASN